VTAPATAACRALHHLDDAAAAVDIELTPAELAALDTHYRVREAGGF